jgi:hypothetical protein
LVQTGPNHDEDPRNPARFVLRNRVELLERRGEGVRQAPHRAGRKLPVVVGCAVEIVLVDDAVEMTRGFQFSFDKRAVDNHFRGHVGELAVAPRLDGLYHRLETALHVVDADRDGALEREVFGVFGEDRLKVSVEREVLAHEDAIADSDGQAEALVVRVP